MTRTGALTVAESLAVEIRFRAERRVGELMRAQRETVGLAQGAKGNPGGRGATVVRVDGKPTLAEAGIDKNLADRARNGAATEDQGADEVGAVARDEFHCCVVPRAITGESEEYEWTRI